MQCCLLIWFSGMFFVSLHYMKKWKKYRWICRKNIPFHGDEYRAVLQSYIQGKIGKGEILYELYHRFSLCDGNLSPYDSIQGIKLSDERH